MKMICVYCGSNPGRLPEYRGMARMLGYELAAADWAWSMAAPVSG